MVARVVVLDVVPTGDVWRRADGDFTRGYWHWGFLALPPLLPERLIGGDRRRSSSFNVRAGMGLGREPRRYYSLEILAAYRRILDGPEAADVACG